MELSLHYPWMAAPAPDTQKVSEELKALCHKLQKNMMRFGEQFPSAATQNNIYRIKGNDDWTNGFWSGMQAIGYEFSHEKLFLDGLKNGLSSFALRLSQHVVLDHHDIGFLYSLSAGALFLIDEDPEAKTLLIQAADVLMKRYQQQGQFIQAWGKMGEPTEYRLIIDSLLNLPLLYQAAKLTGETRYRDVADRHFSTLMTTVFRENFSTFHTFFFDPVNGAPVAGKTFQGFSDNSCWARGQAWAILGLPLVWRLSGLTPDRAFYDAVCEYFLDRLPADGIPYWDLCFTAEDNQPRDTSALAITICGLLEADRLFAEGNYRAIALSLLSCLKSAGSASDDPECEGLLKHGVYAFAEQKGVNECNLWGDYFYMEALCRVYNSNWKGYWG